ncbi:methyltransferase domain-containing protein [Candidatus Saccharibacteria bacterium]|nr:methyltransferase domain-containing protein [Candidatus Saccharibacteria bacterium]
MRRESKPVLGQHWLPHGPSLAAMAAAAELSPGEVVLEIGTGPGYLTDELLKTGAAVVSLEYDRSVFDKARLKYGAQPPPNLRLLQGDIRRFDWPALGPSFKICANIPYYLSANLLRQLTELADKPALAALLLPEAVADKLTAVAKRSLLAALVQLHYAVEAGPLIPKEMFSPPPKIDSKIIVLRHRPAFSNLEPDAWPRLVGLLKAAFAAPRKQLIVNLGRNLELPRAELETALGTAGVRPRQRAEELSNDQWLALLRALPPA